MKPAKNEAHRQDVRDAALLEPLHEAVQKEGDDEGGDDRRHHVGDQHDAGQADQQQAAQDQNLRIGEGSQEPVAQELHRGTRNGAGRP